MMKRLDLGLFIALIALAAAAAGLGFDAPASKAPAAPPPPALTPTLGPSATPTPVPPLPSSPTPRWWPVSGPGLEQINSLTGLDDADLWAVGVTTTYHGEGTSWTPVPIPSATWGPTYLAQASDGAADSLWATGGDATSGGAVVMHGDGQGWTIIDEEPSGTAGTRPALNPSGLYGKDVSAYSADGALVVMQELFSGFDTWAVLLRCDHSACAEVTRSAGEHQQPAAIAAFGADDVWIVGTDQQPAPPTPGPGGMILHWDGHQLTDSAHPDVGALLDVSGSGPDDVWAAGAAGFLHWNGTAWSQVASPAVASVVSARAPGDAWAYGVGGFVHWDGSTWTISSSTPYTITSILPLAADDVWAAGHDNAGHGAIEHYTALPTFEDVPVAAPFYPYIAWLSDAGIISGYDCGGPGEPCDAYGRAYFRPGANVTRGQLLKMTVEAAGWPSATPTGSATFADVPAGSAFYAFIETGAAHGIISGYACGGPGEPCDAEHRPYFRPNAPITRGQLAKVISLAAGLVLPGPSTPTFADVPAGQPFYPYVGAVAAAGVVSGYDCGGPGEPCPGRYFRPGATATRGQVSKFVTLAFHGGAAAKRP